MADRNAFQLRASTEEWTLDGDLTIEPRRDANDVRNAAEFRKERLPILDAEFGVTFEDADVRGGAEQAGLQRALETVVDGKRDDERCHTGGDSENGDDGDDRDNCLLALRPKVTKRDHPFEAGHRLGGSIGRMIQVAQALCEADLAFRAEQGKQDDVADGFGVRKDHG